MHLTPTPRVCNTGHVTNDDTITVTVAYPAADADRFRHAIVLAKKDWDRLRSLLTEEQKDKLGSFMANELFLGQDNP